MREMSERKRKQKTYDQSCCDDFEISLDVDVFLVNLCSSLKIKLIKFMDGIYSGSNYY